MKRKSIVLSCFLAVLFVAVANLSAKSVRGTGKIVSKTINVPSFTGLQLASSADVEITKGSSFSVVLTDYENLIEYHEFTVTTNKLKIGIKNACSINNSKAKIKITLPGALYSVYVAGSGDVVLNNIETLNELSIAGSGNIKSVTKTNYNNLDMKIAGSGDISLTGTARAANVVVMGSGDVNLSELASQTVDCKINGSGDIKVFAKETLKATINGSGDITYRGNPKVEQRVHGSGSITHE